jgi:peptidyl-prolyl cis-trans isomerase NIMA-interacting 1
VRHSNSKHLPYYFNAAEKNSRWEPPAGTDTEKLKLYMARYHSSSLEAQPAPPGKIRAAHLLVKHNQSRRASSWREVSHHPFFGASTCTSGGHAVVPDCATSIPLLGEESGGWWFRNTGPRVLFCSATQLTTAHSQAEITRSKSDAEKIIRDYEARIHRGEVSLGELALTESDCSSARKRGDLGYFGRGDMQKEFEDAAFALKPGQISGLVDTASGLHLIER